MKNLMYLSVVLILASCGTTEEPEIIIADTTTDSVEVVVETKDTTTFDVTGIDNVGDLLDTLETIGTDVTE
jgi:hypothetical protein